MSNFKILLFKYSESEQDGWGLLEKIKSTFRKNREGKNDEFDYQDLDKRRIQNYGVIWENGDTILCMCNETQLINFICKVRIPSKENGLFDYTTPLFLQKPINFEYKINSEPLYKLLNPGKSENTRTTLFNLSDFEHILNQTKSKIIEYNPSQKKEIEKYFFNGDPIEEKTQPLGEVKMSEELTQEQINEKFSHYKNKGRIEFITFHPSYSYEEFVEGLTARSVPDEASPRYFVNDGLFKKLSIRAIWSAIRNLDENKSIASFDDAYDKLLEIIDEKSEAFATVRGKEFSISHNDNDNLIGKPKDSEKEKGYIVSKARLYKLMLAKDKVTKPSDIRPIIGGCNASIYYAIFQKIKEHLEESSEKELDFEKDYELIKERVLNKIQSKETINFSNADKFVLIIDEINRGDISKILGELITLLEEDKRLGQENELTVKLPSSNEIFGAPPNLYVIGTMNTADRSIALIDVALRRRFRFHEMMPELDENSNLYKYMEKELGSGTPEFNELDTFRKCIRAINDKICSDEMKDIGRDKQIGHSFLFKIGRVQGLIKKERVSADIRKIWNYEIIPLLEEYCYGDDDKLRELLKVAADLKDITEHKHASELT